MTERRLAAIMFSDIVGYTALMGESEQKGLAVRERHRALLGALAASYAGRIVDENGDELVLIFGSALDAVDCALAAQSRLAEDPELTLRIGIHSGDVVLDGGRIYGDGVNVASRIRPLAEPGGIAVSDQVYDSIKNQASIETTALGPQELKNVDRPVAAFAVTGAASAPRANPAIESPRKGPLWVSVAALAIVLVAAVAGLVTGIFDASPEPPIRSVAVLSFADMSPARDQEYLGDGIAEEIMGGLAKVEELRVTARTSAFAFKRRNEDIQAIGDQLGVGAVVEGSVRKAGDRLRITAKLIRVVDGFELWSDRFDRKLDDVFAIQEEIARATVDALKVRLVGAKPLVRPTTGSVRAFELYATGRHVLDRRTEEGLRKAVDYFRRALEIDPNYLLAYVGLADSHSLAFAYAYQGEDALSEAEGAARRAIALDESSGEAHTSLGYLRSMQYRWDESEEEFRVALRLNPAYSTAYHWYGFSLMKVGRLEEARVEIERALQLDPLSPIINRNAGQIYFHSGDFTRAIEPLRKALALNPDEPLAPMYLLRANLALGQEPEVFGWFPGQDDEELRAAYGEGGISALLRRALETRLGETRGPCTERPDIAAIAYALLDEVERMYECAEHAVKDGMGGSPAVIAHDPALAEYRREPRFMAILKRMGLEG